MEGYSSDIALFQKPLVEEGIESYQFVEYRPSSTEGSSFEFHIPGSGALYTDWTTTRLVLKVGMAQADGSSPPTPNTGAPVNLTLQSLFRQVDVLVGGKNITSEVGINYPYKAIMDIFFFFLEWGSKKVNYKRKCILKTMVKWMQFLLEITVD